MNKKLKEYSLTKFDESTVKQIEENYNKELKQMLATEVKILSKNQFKTAKKAILPRIAMYKSFRKVIDEETAKAYSTEFAYRDFVGFKNFATFMTKTKIGSKAFNKIFLRALKSDVWDSQVNKSDKNCLHFDINRCLYSDLCTKYGCPEFTTVFCQGDYFVFADMQKVKFSRNQTLGEGGSKCDFHYDIVE